MIYHLNPNLEIAEYQKYLIHMLFGQSGPIDLTVLRKLAKKLFTENLAYRKPDGGYLPPGILDGMGAFELTRTRFACW